MRALTDGLDPMRWAKRPASQIALNFVSSGAKKDRRLREILADLIRDGIATEDGRLLKRWDGMEGKWVAP